MYLVPFSMGPIGGKLSKNGIELTDSSYVAVSMRVMTRVGSAVLKCISEDNGSFVKCLHTVGQPLKPGQEDMAWPCNPEKVLVAHKPHSAEIISFGSGYGGNSLLGKKCFALRIGSTLAKMAKNHKWWKPPKNHAFRLKTNMPPPSLFRSSVIMVSTKFQLY